MAENDPSVLKTVAIDVKGRAATM